MGRQPFLTRLVLGRSAFEAQDKSSDGDDASSQASISSFTRNSGQYVQRYDRQGHPQNLVSTELMRQSRYAQNDVLTTVGVCVRVDKNGNQIASDADDVYDLRPAVEAIMKENEYGISLLNADWTLFCLTDLCLLGLKQRLQTFQFHSGMPFSTVIRTEWSHYGPSKFLFAGTLASLMFRQSRHVLRQVYRNLFNYLNRRFVWPILEPRLKQRNRRTLDILGIILKFSAFTLVAPLEIYATLQRLDLLPVSPPFPSLREVVPLMALNPGLISGTNNTQPFFGRATALLSSPLLLLWILTHVREHVDQSLFLYIRLALPKPSNPSLDSTEAAVLRDLTNDHVLGLSRDNALNQWKRNHTNVYTRLQTIGVYLMRWKPWETTTSTHASSEARTVQLPIAQTDEDRQVWQDQADDYHATLASARDTLPPEVSQFEGDDYNSVLRFAQNSGAPLDVVIPELPDAIDIDQVDVVGGPFAAMTHSGESSHNTKYPKAPDQQHHVTALTAIMADALAMHLSTNLADILLLPLEALFVRSVASSFLSTMLSTAPTGPAAGWRSQVFPFRTWFGWGVGNGGFRSYVTNMTLCGVFELTVGMGIWQLSSGAAWLMGRKRFGWGEF